jgi:MFS family permease
VPFLLSVVLIGVGYVVRRSVDESPVFAEMAERKQRTTVPVVELFRKHGLLVVLAALIFAGNNAAGYTTTGGFITSYATNPDGPVGLGRTPVLLAITGAAALWAVTTYVSGHLADRIGRKRTYLIGYGSLILTVFPMFLLVDAGHAGLLFLGLALFTLGLGFAYGPQAAWYSELFPASVRFSGVAISYALGAVIGGAFAPTIAAALVQSTGNVLSVGAYLLGMFGVAVVATLLLRDRPGIDLGVDNQAEQEAGATVLGARRELGAVHGVAS